MQSPKFTTQQAAAITTRHVSVALSAGAGCGKTFVLTQRFLSHLEPHRDRADLRALVAITFTDRAAREMRDRIRAACQNRLESCDDADVDHWLGILRGLDTARVSTIHSFCTSLLRAHAVEAGLDPRFAVLEPPLADTLREAAAKDVLHRLLIGAQPDADAYVLRLGLERSRELLSVLAAQRFRMNNWASADTLTPEELALRWQTAWQGEFIPRMVDRLRRDATATTLASLFAAHVPTHPVMRQRCATLREKLDPTQPWSDVISELTAVREAAGVKGGGGKAAWPNEDVYAAVRDGLTALREQIDKLLKRLQISPEDIAFAATMAVQGLRLTRQVVVEYEARKHAAAALDFDDLLLRARDLLRDHPEVCDRFARGIRLLMVDEFQDTDPVQAEIVRLLCGSALTLGKLFLVGDVKQSIYRFRRADPKVFVHLRSQIPSAGQLSLTTNFRSQPEILRFVNFLFGRRWEQYEPLHPMQVEQLSPLPTVEFLFATSDATPASATSGSHPPAPIDDDPSAAQLRAREADWIARRIAALLADPTPRIRTRDPQTGQTALRRVEAGDIVILFRALTNVQVYESALREYGLDYYLVGGKTFYAQQEVFDLLNLCQALDTPDDAVALVGVLRSPFFGLSDDTLQSLRPGDGDWWTRLQQPPPPSVTEDQQARVRFAGTVLASLRAKKDRLPIVDLLNDAVAQTGYDASLLVEHLGHRKVANLRKLIEQAAPFDRGELFTLKDFVHRLQTSVLAETDEEFATTLPEGGQVVRLMSVHQAKGLEFPLVIVADLNRSSKPVSASAVLHSDWGALVRIPEEFGIQRQHLGLQMLTILEHDAELEETLRLFYVAVTRARDHLILSAGMDADRTPKSPWMQLLAEQFDLATGLPKHDAWLGTYGSDSGRGAIPDVRAHYVPPVAERVTAHRDAIPLSQLVASVMEAEPAPLPETARVFSAQIGASRWFSVSELETLAEAQFPALPRQPAAARRRKPASSDAPPEALETTAPHTVQQLGLSFTEGSPRDGKSAPSEAEALGTLVHAVLERCDFRSRDGWINEIATAARRARIELTPHLEANAQHVLHDLAAAPLCDELASARTLLREVDFYLPWPMSGQAARRDVIVGICDCLYETDERRWRLIDFKTGQFADGASDAELLAPYRWQLALYAWAFADWHGQPLDSLALAYVRPRVRIVPFQFDTAVQNQLRKQLDAVIQSTRT